MKQRERVDVLTHSPRSLFTLGLFFITLKLYHLKREIDRIAIVQRGTAIAYRRMRFGSPKYYVDLNKDNFSM